MPKTFVKPWGEQFSPRGFFSPMGATPPNRAAQARQKNAVKPHDKRMN